jgi:hypothetical protein
MREALLAFIVDALRDQGTVAGNQFTITMVAGGECIIRVALGENGPFEYYTVKVIKNI